MMTIPWQTRVHIWFRLLLLQASWNYERLQGLGFFFALLPGLKKLYPAERIPEISRRYTGYFNTHPYLAPMVAGAVLKLEEENACSGDNRTIDIAEFKEMVAAPYAAIGDALFWGGLRPLAAAVALFFAVKGILWAPLIFLVFYNLVPLWFRIVFFQRGYRQGLHSVEFIQNHNLADWAIHIKEAAVVVLGGFCAFLVFTHLDPHEPPGWLGLLVLLPMIVLGLSARKGLSILLLVFLTCMTIVLVGMFWADMALVLGF